MKLIKPILLLSAAALAFNASSRPARPTPYKVRQADGTEISLRLVGDEYFHFTVEAASGMPVVESNGTYFYASVDEATGKVVASANAVTATPVKADAAMYTTLVNAMQAEQQMYIKEYERAVKADPKAAESRAASSHFGLFTSLNNVTANFVHEGDVPCLVILVQFSDKKIVNPKSTIEQYLNSDTPSSEWGGWAGGSARSYFIKQSHGKFRPRFDVYGTYTAKNNATYYNGRESTLLRDALNELSSQIDLSMYDVNGDGAVDNVYMIFAGTGGHLDGVSIWPANSTTNIKLQNLTINRYSYCNELDDANYLQGIGTFCHEFGHVIGLADLYTLGNNYPSNTTDYWTPTYWDVMDTGCDLCYGYYPPNMSAFERHALGWAEPYQLNKPEFIYMSAKEDDGKAAMVRNPDNENEVFYFEWRNQQGWDKHHCGSGLLVWHVQYNEQDWNRGSVNNSSTNPLVKVVAADGKSGSNAYNAFYQTTYYKNDSYLAGDVFPGTTGKTELTTTSSPALLRHDGKPFVMADGTNAEISQIGTKSKNGKTYMAFSVAGAADRSSTTKILGEEEFAAIDGISSDMATKLEVICAGRELTVSGAAADRLTAYDIAGRAVATAAVSADGTARLTVPAAGMYILRAGSTTAKVMVR
ncbi:MAG: M6 family metalloprotease domain-containing protein [Muribaculaceae bacterium]|nr:M6 family metalloprotease domain-containing protein [Muribaculaceae bacterium]